MITDPPSHIAIIMDGNGRHAQKLGLPRFEGHRAGLSKVLEVCEFCLKADVKYLTAFGMSTENFTKRPAQEVGLLLKLLSEAICKYKTQLVQEGIRFSLIGSREKFDPDLLSGLQALEKITKSGDKLVLTVAFNYGGRDDIVRAAKKLMLNGQEITEATLSSELMTSNLPDPDLVIRTGGLARMSNFLLWQSAYSELHFTDVLWPEFSREDFGKAIGDYMRRERKYGSVI